MIKYKPWRKMSEEEKKLKEWNENGQPRFIKKMGNTNRKQVRKSMKNIHHDAYTKKYATKEARVGALRQLGHKAK